MFCWTLHPSRGTKQCDYAAVAADQKVYCFGTFHEGNTAQIGVDVLNTVSLCWRKLPPVTTGRGECHHNVPSRREGHTAVLIGYIIYIWGGLPHCNVLYAFDVDAHEWFKPEVSGTVPGGRYYHSACVLGKVMFIHGGFTLHYRHNDTYKFDTNTMVWSLINTRGTWSSGHSATIIGTKMFVFGGWWAQYYNTITVFDTETNCWLNTPPARLPSDIFYDHSAFTYNGELYIVYGAGGLEEDDMFDDMWKLNPETFSWKKVELKGKGLVKVMSCCMVGDRIILCGGNKPNDLIVLDLSPSLKTLCKLAVVQYDLERSELPHNIRWELAAMTTKSHLKRLSKNKRRNRQTKR